LEHRLQAAEEQARTLQAALGDSQAALEQQAQAHTAEISRRDAAYGELEHRLQAAEEQARTLQAALGDSQAALEQQAQAHSTEISQLSLAYRDLGQKFKDTEEQLLSTQSALQDAESKLADQIEKYAAASTQWSLALSEWQWKLESAEQRHADEIQAALRESEARIGKLTEDNQLASMQLEKTRQELHQLGTEFAEICLRHQRLSRLASSGVALTTSEGLVLECNDAAARMFGFSNAEDALSRNGGPGFHIYAFEGELLNRLQKDGKLEGIQWASLNRDGRLVRFEENAVLVERPAGESPFVERILTDISRVYKLTEEMRRTRKVESSGDLAAVTVKRLNDLCMSLVKYGERLKETPGDGDTVKQLADSIFNDATRGLKHARQFLSISRKPERHPVPVGTHEILANNKALLHSLVGEDIDLQILPAARDGLVSADPQEMIQLITSLVASSREALPLGGAVLIEISNLDMDATDVRYPAGMQPGIYVQITLSADGCTVQPERRTGPIRMIVERMGGWMESTHTQQTGNTHRIYLPRVEPFRG
jgi:PAS domain-containing protein